MADRQQVRLTNKYMRVTRINKKAGKVGQTWVWIVAILTVGIWAGTFVSSKILINNGLAPADIFLYRFIIAYVAIWIVSPKTVWSRTLLDELRLMSLGITGGSLYFLTENTAIKYSTASNVAILVESAPLLTTLLVAIFYKEERISARQTIGSFIAITGMILVILNGQIVLKLNPIGDTLAVGAALSWAIYSIILRQISEKYNIVFITRKVFLYGLLTIIPYFIFIKPLNHDTTLLCKPVVWIILAYLGLIASMTCFVTWNWALRRLGTVRTTNLIYGQCIFTMLTANIVLGERITWMAVIGTVILITGMLLAIKSNPDNGQKPCGKGDKTSQSGQ